MKNNEINQKVNQPSQSPEQQNNNLAPDFLTVSSIQALRLLFQLRVNYAPLFDVMKRYANFDEFVAHCAGKDFESVVKGSEKGGN